MSPSAATRVEWSRRLAQALVSAGQLSQPDAAALLEETSASGRSLASLLVSRGLVPAQVIVSDSRSAGSDADRGPLQNRPSQDAVMALPAAVANDYDAIGYAFHEGTLHVAFAEPPSSEDLNQLSALCGTRVSAVLGDPAAIERLQALAQAAPASSSVASVPPASSPSMPTATAVPTATAAPHPGAGLPTPAAGSGSNGGAPPPPLTPAQAAAAAAAEVALHIDDLLRYAVSVGASDLHLTSEMPGCIRLHGAIRPIEGCPVLDNETIREMIFGILPASQRERFEDEKELDTSHSIAGVGRFRVNVFRQRGTIAAALRSIPHEIPPFDSLGIPDAIRSFSEMRRGLVLVTGPTGSGKSTTLASLVDIINRSKPLHIITIEDPIEFLHTHKQAIINQREVGEDTIIVLRGSQKGPS